MKESIINRILETGKQIPKEKLKELSIESLNMILTLRMEMEK